MFRTSSQNNRLISADEFIDKIGLSQPYFEEWLLSKCGALSEQELSDLVDYKTSKLLVKYAKSKQHSAFSSGYIEYLKKKGAGISQCKKDTILKSQKKTAGIN